MKKRPVLRLDYAAFKYKPSPKVIKAIKKELKNANEYPDESYDEIKKALSQTFKLRRDHFIIGNGADELIDTITRAFVKEGEEIIIPTPTFSQFEEAAKRISAKRISVNCAKEKVYEIKSDEILAHVTKKTKLIWICSPNNPTGNIIPEGTIEEIISKSKIPVVVDECLSEMKNSNLIRFVKDYSNFMLLKTFSKGYCLAGLRVGFLMAQPVNINKIEKIKQIFNVNRLAVKAAIAALQDQAYYRRIWRKLRKEKIKQIRRLRSLKVSVVGKESNFLLLDFKNEKISKRVYEGLLRRGIRIFPGWDKEFSNLDGRYCRVVIGTPKQNRRFSKELKKVLRGLKWI
jgi:histidinol-phosphate aminotransferase